MKHNNLCFLLGIFAMIFAILIYYAFKIVMSITTGIVGFIDFMIKDKIEQKEAE